MHFIEQSQQSVHHLHGDKIVTLALPAANERLRRTNLEWGDACVMMSPAFWAAQSWMWEMEEPDHFRLGKSLAEELIACLLGGYGIPAEVGLAAYERIRQVWADAPEALYEIEAVEKLLTQPLVVGGRNVRYRFAKQKAEYLSHALRALPSIDEMATDLDLRDALCGLKGLGPKTASWIVRNWRASDQVAILDVHILRAGRLLGLFDDVLTVEKNYREIEDLFIAFSQDIGAKASILDSVMWMTTRPTRTINLKSQVKMGQKSTEQLQLSLV